MKKSGLSHKAKYVVVTIVVGISWKLLDAIFGGNYATTESILIASFAITWAMSKDED